MFALSKVEKPIGALTDELLIAHYQQSGKTQYIDELYNRYVHLVYGTCLKYLKGKDESKEMTMVIFGKLLEKLRSGKVESFNHWLYSLSRNECLSYLSCRADESAAQKDWEAAQRLEPQSEELEVKVEAAKTRAAEEAVDERVQAAIQQLELQQQECIRLFFYENKSYKEIAGQTSYSTEQVKSHLQNGKRRLKKLLATSMDDG